MARPPTVTFPIRFAVVDEDGTHTLRDVAAHAHHVAEAWSQVGRTMAALADRLGVLVDGGAPSASFDQPVCESCSRPATVVGADGSWWCVECDTSARNLGYDEQEGA